MKLKDTDLNVVEFDLRTHRRYQGEPMEMFACKECRTVVLGLPDCHLVFYNPNDLRQTAFYNRSGKIKCPLCKSFWYGGGRQDEYTVVEVSKEDALKAGWSWLFLQPS